MNSTAVLVLPAREPARRSCRKRNLASRYAAVARPPARAAATVGTRQSVREAAMIEVRGLATHALGPYWNYRLSAGSRAG